jgi:predicted MFS family arabinose efflux permease
MLIAYPLTGIGGVMVSPLTRALVGYQIPKEKRASIISFISAGAAGLYLIGGPFISYLERSGGWRSAFLWYAIPIAFASFIVAFLWVPKTHVNTNPGERNSSSFIGFSQVFSNRSAVGCLIGTVLAMASWQGILVFSSSYYRQQFGLEIGTGAILTIGSALIYIGGNLFAGRIVNSFGMKRLSVWSLILMGIFVVFWLNAPLLWMVILFDYIGSVFWGIRPIAAQSLTLEQLPKSRGSMMSMYTAATSLGSAVGVAFSGYLLLHYGYWMLGYVFGALNMLSALVFAVYTKEPRG